MAHIGFLINPIAGMGGRVGLKGTDDLAAEAARRGALPHAQDRAGEALGALKQHLDQAASPPKIEWLTCAGSMGADALAAAGFDAIEAVHRPAAASSAADTRAAVSAFLARGVDLVLFCGGDGTARDIAALTGTDTPILGIPAGVKMYSGVFGITPARTADTLWGFIEHGGTTTADILDLDERRYRADEWAVRLHASATTPADRAHVQCGKLVIAAPDDDSVKHAIAEQLAEDIAPGTLVLLGPGSTVEAIARALGIDKTLLGIDAILDGRPAGRDLDERQIAELLIRHPRRMLVVSPIGAQGFVLGRGNQQLSPKVVRQIGLDNIVVVATPAKLARTPVLRFDTGDSQLDADLLSRDYWPVVVGYRRLRMVKAAG